MGIDLEKFPDSAAAKRMLSYVTRGWYDKSYVGKWTYEVMGREIDAASKILEELPYQFFVDTATWGLMYHELKYGLPIRKDLSYEERKRLIKERKANRPPMNPWRMEQIISALTGCEVHVHDVNDSGYDYGHPNVFGVQIAGDTAVNMSKVIKKMRELKQSHTSFVFEALLMVIMNEEHFDVRTIMRMTFAWWERCLDGRYFLDGSILLDYEYPTTFVSRNRFRDDQKERFLFAGPSGIFLIRNEEKFIPKTVNRATFMWREGDRLLDGKFNLDGSETLSQDSPPYWSSTKHRTDTGRKDDFGFSIFIPSKAIRLDGKADLDGTYLLNFGREDV